MFAQDNRQFTIMSYFGGYNAATGTWALDGTSPSYTYSQTPMVYDIAAIQALYGADTTTRTGDTVYGYNCNFITDKDIYNFSLNAIPIFTIYDAAGANDALDCSVWAGNQSIDLTPGSYSSVRGLNYNVGIAFNTFIEKAIGGAGNDTLKGNAVANTLTGNDGNDTLDGGLGIDTLIGGLGNDTYIVNLTATNIMQDTFGAGEAGDGIDTIILREGVSATLGAVALALEIENLDASATLATALLNLTGNASDNILTGNAAANLLSGLDGNDTLIGGAGNDTLGGGAGNDVLNGGEGSDIYTVGDATYKLQAEINDTGLSGIDELRFTSLLAGTTLTVFAGDTGLETVVIGTGTAAVADITGTVALNVNASAATNALTITGNAGANSIVGGAGNDLLFGDAGNDTLIGGEGNDTLRSGLGSDVLDGGNGDDAYAIDVSTDVILADSGGIDTVNVYYATGTYTLAADLEHITLFGATAINGTGNALNNTITGNAGNNILTGGLGNDILSGGLGQDIFDFNAVIESLLGVTRDIITDFSHAQLDKIDLSAIDANSMLLNDQAFLSAILTGGAFTSAGQLRLQGNVLSGNTDNDFNTSEFEIQLTGIDTLTSIDFFL